MSNCMPANWRQLRPNSLPKRAFVERTSGAIIVLLGGRLMGSSLDLLSRTFPDSRLRLDQVGTLFGEQGFGTISQIVGSTLEGALFSACVVGATIIGERSLGISHRPKQS